MPASPQIGFTLKITQWVPTNLDAKWPCVLSWMQARQKENLPDDCDDIRFMRGFTEGHQDLRPWNSAVEEFLKSDSDWLWSTHGDVVFHPGTLKRLLSWNKPLISALIFMRQSPVVPHIWKSYDDDPSGRMANRIQNTREWFFDHLDYVRFGSFLMEPKPEDALVEVSFTSTSCTLIHRSVLEKMKAPWFTMDSYGGGGEDRRFHEGAKAVGFPGYVDRSCVCGHLVGDVPTSSLDFMMWSQVSEFKNTGEQEEDAAAQNISAEEKEKWANAEIQRLNDEIEMVKKAVAE